MATATTTKATTKATPKAPRAAKAAPAKARDLTLREAQAAAFLLKQSSDPTRLRILMSLSEGERHVGALCAMIGQSQPAVSHHLALLRHGGIITPRRQGKNNFYALSDRGQALAGVIKAVVG